jgi:SAM-dependent methyltransferase/DNA-binding transcriptional ArsR family regulator
MADEQRYSRDLPTMFRALGDPTRLRIFQFLRSCAHPVAVSETGDVRRVEGPTAGEVCCRITGIERVTSTISFHLKELRLAGLITMERRGRNMVCTVNADTIQRLQEFLGNGCCPPDDKEQSMALSDRDDVRELVKERYGAAARMVLDHKEAACCSGGNIGTGKSGACCSNGPDPITRDLYGSTEASEIPEAALLASLGCGNPTALASLAPGEVVLDLGSGGGIDVLLSARRVGPTGFAYGLDMTDDMLELAEKNRAEAGAENVRFLKGHIESIPLPDNSVDVIISNCVINLSGDKGRVIAEAFRVLKPGGRFAVSDVVVDGELPDALRSDMEAYVGCVAGALERSDYVRRLEGAGFVKVSIEPTRRYQFADLENAGYGADAIANLTNEERQALDGRVMGAFIRASKPCCGQQ